MGGRSIWLLGGGLEPDVGGFKEGHCIMLAFESY